MLRLSTRGKWRSDDDAVPRELEKYPSYNKYINRFYNIRLRNLQYRITLICIYFFINLILLYFKLYENKFKTIKIALEYKIRMQTYIR